MKRQPFLPPSAYTKTVRSKKRLFAERFFGAVAFLYFLFYWENNLIDTTRFELSYKDLPRSLDGLRVVQVSDLHGKSFGKDNVKLLKKIRNERPDLIVVTGDIIDERAPFPEFAGKTIAQLASIAPTFYVTGNHEGQFVDELRVPTLEAIEAAGGTILCDKIVELERGSDGKIAPKPFNGDAFNAPKLLLAGIPDPESALPSPIPDQTLRFELTREWIREKLTKLLPQKSERPGVAILLSHRPEQIAEYAEQEVDLVFTGHAHGGQFRLPWLLPNGLNAPHQGFFPQYTNGRYDLGGTTEIVSRGLGPSVIPTRFYNRPNLVVCALRKRD